MSKPCPCCQTEEGVGYSLYGVHGCMDVHNGGLKLDAIDKGTKERFIICAPVNYCPWCGRYLKER